MVTNGSTIPILSYNLICISVQSGVKSNKVVIPSAALHFPIEKINLWVGLIYQSPQSETNVSEG